MAQPIIGTELAARWASTSSRVAYRVTVDWNRDGFFDDESSHVLSIDTDHSIYDGVLGLPAIGKALPEKATVILDNSTRRYSVNSPGSVSGIYPNLLNGIYRIPIRIELGYYTLAGVPQYLTQFVGEIEDANEHEAGERTLMNFACTGRGIELMQNKGTTILYTDVRVDEFVEALLLAAGIIVHDLDLGSSEIPYAWVDDENLWEELHKLAEAEGALFFFSKEGVPMFKRITTFLERPDSVTPVVELNEGNAFLYADGLNWRDCYNEVVVEWATRYQGMQVEVYTAPDTIVVPPDTTITLEVRYRWPVMYAVVPEYGVDYVAVTSGARVVPAGPTGIETSFVCYGQKGELTIANRMTRHTLYVMDLAIRGFPLIGDEAHQERFQSPLGLIPGDKVYEYRGNPYIQTPEQAYRLAGFMSDWLGRPRRIYRWRGVGCPWLEPLDRVTLKHNVMTPNPGTHVDCYVLGMSQSFSSADGMYEQELLLLAVDNLFAHDDYFIVGQSEYWNALSDKVAY